MNLTFPLFLVCATFLTGMIALLDKFVWAKKRAGAEASWPIEYARTFFPVLLIVLLIRSFLFSNYRIPTGSLEPTVMPGDFITVAKYAYGLRLPVLGTKMIDTDQPKRGDVVVFFYPPNPTIIYAKRLVGLPGDHLQYKDKVLFINGKAATQTYVENTYDREPGRVAVPAIKKIEKIGNVSHSILLYQSGGQSTSFDVVVPPGYYFMMGDNRDNSADSRVWGPVPDKYLIGKALFTWMSWDSNHLRIRWHRIGKQIH